MPKTYLVLSFDHELSLGRLFGSYADNLFLPTEGILAAAESCEVPVTLFTDVLCGIKFREWGETDFVVPYENQLKDAVRRGHEVELHLHPHWLRTTKEASAFHPSGGYSLHDYRDEPYPDSIPGIVDRGVEYLSSVCRQADPGFKSLAFRAGGFSLSPSTGQILSALWDRGIRIDSSVGKGYRFSAAMWSVDWSEMPAEANWYVPLDGPMSSRAEAGMFEVPAVTVPRGVVSNASALLKRVLRRGNQSAPTGAPIYSGDDTFAAKIKRQITPSSWMLTFDLHFLSAGDLLDMLARYLDRHRADEIVFASVVSHPKNMGPYHIRLMREFIERARLRYGEQIEFCTYRDIHGLITNSTPAR